MHLITGRGIRSIAKLVAGALVAAQVMLVAYAMRVDAAAPSIDVPPSLTPLYATVGAPPAAPRPCVTAWLSALVAASPPYALARCVWRI